MNFFCRCFLTLWVVFSFLPNVHAQEQQIKVVPIGETIKPEGKPTEPSQTPLPKSTGRTTPSTETPVVPTPTTATPKKRRPAPTLVKAGESFIVELHTTLSSGLNHEGDPVYFSAVEDVGPKGRPVIKAGAVGMGSVVLVERGKKTGKLKIQFSSIQTADDQMVPVTGGTELEGQGGQAALAVGDRFTANLEKKVVLKGRPKKSSESPIEKIAFIEVKGKGVDADIAKGFVKGNIGIVLEPPKGLSIEDIDLNSLVLYKINSFTLPQPMTATPPKGKLGDQNKNGVQDAMLTMKGWDFIKYQPRGKNVVYFMGKTKAGETFEASTNVTIDY